jgi:hypothetical protein
MLGQCDMRLVLRNLQQSKQSVNTFMQGSSCKLQSTDHSISPIANTSRYVNAAHAYAHLHMHCIFMR